nr:MAG TPA: hypothetical protein [Bacteriophage sp.]
MISRHLDFINISSFLNKLLSLHYYNIIYL